MSALDLVFSDNSGRELLFSAGVEVGRAKGREEFAQHLIRKFQTLKEGSQIGFAAFIRAELVNFQREHS